jgi:hypothetical protein
MISKVKPTKRQAFSWDPEFRERTKDIEEQLGRFTGNKNDIGNKEVFMLALATGFHFKKQRPRPPRATDAVRLSAVREHEFAIFRSIALAHTKDYLILLDQDAMYDIIEEYAAGGLEILVTELDTGIDFKNFLTKLLFEQAKAVSALQVN